jgi:uncharacterized GH25 family protein
VNTQVPVARPNPLSSFHSRSAGSGGIVPLAYSSRTVLTLLNSETGRPIPEARVSIAYFHAGGVAERHNALSDADGRAWVPFSSQERSAGANILVTADGYVPKVISCGEPFPEFYEMQLDPAFTFAGLVVDEDGQPVPNVTVTLDCPSFEHDTRKVESVAFNSRETAAITDVYGEFQLILQAVWTRL